MARPKKNGVEQPLNLDGNNMPMENENAQQSQENAAQQQGEEQVEEFEEEDELPFEVEGYVSCTSRISSLLLSSQNQKNRINHSFSVFSM